MYAYYVQDESSKILYLQEEKVGDFDIRILKTVKIKLMMIWKLTRKVRGKSKIRKEF